jgi:hypothetical protein
LLSATAKLADNDSLCVIQNNDETLIVETYILLSYSKAYYTNIIHFGLEISLLRCDEHITKIYPELHLIYKELTINSTSTRIILLMGLQIVRSCTRQHRFCDNEEAQPFEYNKIPQLDRVYYLKSN